MLGWGTARKLPSNNVNHDRGGTVFQPAGQHAQLYVPRLLDVLAGGSAAEAAFAAGWRRVPVAAFLPWAPSMLSLLDEPHSEALLPALEVRLGSVTFNGG